MEAHGSSGADLLQCRLPDRGCLSDQDGLPAPLQESARRGRPVGAPREAANAAIPAIDPVGTPAVERLLAPETARELSARLDAEWRKMAQT